ncbi:MAG TPA: MarR family transcriptional regulator [Tepidisphaeraceae bacterium]|jgi:DNA-binding MarR family transcriptional regulator
MQVLHNASNQADAKTTADAILEGLPPVMWFIRRHMRRHRTAGMSVPQYRALCVLEKNPTANLGTIAELLGASQPTVSRLVSGLVSRGYVARKTCSDDRRQCEIVLTARGRAKVEDARQANIAALAEEIRHLDPAQQRTIVSAMQLLHGTFTPQPNND